jgi:rod shape-determining protein MreC
VSAISTKRKRAIALLSLTSIILITLDLQGSASTSVLRGTFGVFFRPIEGVARVITRPVSNAWHGITHYNAVTQENDLLREKIAQQEGAAVAAAASVRLSQELLALNGLPTLAGINSVSAQVIGDSPSNFSQNVEINQGSDSGVKVGMPVMNAAGLVGKITKVFPRRSIVMLITDPEYALSVKVINNPEAASPINDPEASATTSSTTTTTTIPKPQPTSNIPGFTPGTTTMPLTTVNVPVSIPSLTPTLTVPNNGALPIRETGILEGRGPSRVPIVRFIDSAQRFGTILPGAPIVTSGGSLSLAPPDIVVGTVSKVTDRLGTSGPILEINLVADLANLSFVRILLYQPITEQVKP